MSAKDSKLKKRNEENATLAKKELTQNGKGSSMSNTNSSKQTRKNSPKNGAIDYNELSKAMLKDKEKYATEKFKDCWPAAKEISETITNTVWDDSMKIMQDYPSTYTQTAAVCFFSFLCAAINAHLEMRYAKAIPENELPKLEPVEVKSDMVKLLLKRSEQDLNAEGQFLLKNLLERDFGYLFAVIKAINIENTALHNLLVSGFRFYVWEIMIPHLFLSEKKKEEAHA